MPFLRTRVLPKDILISITAELGMIGLAPDALGDAYVNQHIALARSVDSANSARSFGVRWADTTPTLCETPRSVSTSEAKHMVDQSLCEPITIATVADPGWVLSDVVSAMRTH